MASNALGGVFVEVQADLDAWHRSTAKVKAEAKVFNKEVEKLTKISGPVLDNAQVNKASASLNNLSKGTKNYGFVVQNASYQIGDFAVQMAGGQKASLALAQQLPQLLGGFGMFGALAGAAVAIGGALVPVLFDLGDGAKTFAEKLDDLEEAVSGYRGALKRARADTESLQEEFGSAGASVRELVRSIAELERNEALKALKTTVSGVVDEFGRFQNLRGFLELGNAFTGIVGLTREEKQLVNELSAEFRSLATAEGPEEQAAAFKKVRLELNSVLTTLGLAGDKQTELVKKLHNAEAAATRLAGAADATSYQNAADSAAKVTTELERALSVFEDLQQAISSTGLSQVGLDAQLGALQSGASREMAKVAGQVAEMQKQISPLLTGFDTADAAALGQIKEYQSTLEKQVGTQQQINSIIDARRKATQAANKKPKLNEFERGSNSVQDQIRALEIEAATFGMSESAAASYRLEKELLNAATANGSALTAAEVQQTNELVAQYQTANDNVLMLQNTEKNREASLNSMKATTKGVFSDLYSGLRSGQSAWESFGDAANNVLDRIVDNLLNNVVDALFQVNNSGSSSSGLGGILGSISGVVSGLFGGSSASSASSVSTGHLFANGGVMTSNGPIPLNAYASGGVATSPQMALFGEGSHNEAYVPLPDGRSIPVTMTQAANSNAGGAAGGQSSVVIQLAEGLVGSIVQEANQNTVQIVQAAAGPIANQAVSNSKQDMAKGGYDANMSRFGQKAVARAR